MAWTIKSSNPRALIFSETVPALATKTLVWPTDVPTLLLGGDLEILGVRMELMTTATPGTTRRPKIVVADATGDVIHETTSLSVFIASVVGMCEFSVGYSPAAANVELAGNVIKSCLPVGLVVPSGGSLTATQDGTSEVNTITANATAATGGTFTITVNGQTTSPAIAFNATAAAVQAALEALSNVVPGDVLAIATTGANLGVNNAVVTLRWTGSFEGQNVTITADFSGLTGNPHVFATPTAGGLFDATDSTIVHVRARIIG